jgi:hypothetical protein
MSTISSVQDAKKGRGHTSKNPLNNQEKFLHRFKSLELLKVLIKTTSLIFVHLIKWLITILSLTADSYCAFGKREYGLQNLGLNWSLNIVL